MTILKVLTFPDPFLKKTAKPVTEFDEKLKKFAEDMFDTMYDEHGIGLAATQVGEDKRMLVIDVDYSGKEDSERNPTVIINPVIASSEGESIEEEGCLSVPEFRAEVKRKKSIVLEYNDLEGKKQTLETDGLFSICIQHEMDHLNGILFIDHLPALKQRMVKTRLKKLAKANA